MTAARYGIATRPYGRGRARLWFVWTSAPYRRAPDVAGLAYDNADPVPLALDALRELGVTEAQRSDPLADAVRKVMPKAADVRFVPHPNGSVRIESPPAPKGREPARRLLFVSLCEFFHGAVWAVFTRKGLASGEALAHGVVKGKRGAALAQARAEALALVAQKGAEPLEADSTFARAYTPSAQKRRANAEAYADGRRVLIGATREVDGGCEWGLWTGSGPAMRGDDPLKWGCADDAIAAMIAGELAGERLRALRLVWLDAATAALLWAVRDGQTGERVRVDGRRTKPMPAWRAELGLPTTGTVTRAQLVAAWRRKASTTHPDHGGEASAFVKAREAYEAGLREVSA